jgi:outer membrane protein assembly factor BamE
VGGLASVFVLTGCIPSVENVQRDWVNRIFRPYVPDVVQGNFISSEQYAKLQLGLTREQVQQIMGTSLLADYFHANRWDYIFEFKREGQKINQERLVTIIFADNKVIKFEGNALPTETELVAEIDNYAKRKRTFWQYLTGANKGPAPVAEPELLVQNLPQGGPITGNEGTTTPFRTPQSAGPLEQELAQAAAIETAAKEAEAAKVSQSAGVVPITSLPDTPVVTNIRSGDMPDSTAPPSNIQAK